MRIVCVGYRDWSISIYKSLIDETDHDFLLIDSKEDFSSDKIYSFAPSIVLFYGWSWIIPSDLIINFNCLMLHPSPLPKYRGGSPLQNQIINFEKESAVTIFLMDEGLDTGPICAQQSFSLEGDLSDIFMRIETIGIKLTKKILAEGINVVAQDNKLATVYKRRKAFESEITPSELATKSAQYLHNKIRMLQSPYPSAFIIAADGKKVFLHKSSLDE